MFAKKTTTFRRWLNVIIKSKKYSQVAVYLDQNTNGWWQTIPLEKNNSTYLNKHFGTYGIRLNI